MKKLINSTLLALVILSTTTAFAADTNSTSVNWVAASIRMVKGERNPNAFYNWSGDAKDAWQSLGVSARDVCYGKDDKGQGVWVAAADTRYMYEIKYSTDGRNWNDASFIGRSPLISKVEYGYDLSNHGMWVAVGRGSIYYSIDGRLWRMANYNGRPAFNAVSYGNHKWIAVGEDGAIHTSIDGINWVDHSLRDAGTFISIGFGKLENTMGWIINGDKCLWSTDGVNWNNYSAPLFDSWYWDTIKYANGTWMAAGDLVISSKDGRHWKSESIPSGHDAGAGIAHGKDNDGRDMWVAFASNEMFALKEGTPGWQKLNFKSATDCANNEVHISSNEIPSP